MERKNDEDSSLTSAESERLVRGAQDIVARVAEGPRRDAMLELLAQRVATESMDRRALWTSENVTDDDLLGGQACAVQNGDHARQILYSRALAGDASARQACAEAMNADAAEERDLLDSGTW